MTNNFVHLHVHSDYSFQDGVTKVSKIVNRAKQLGMPAIALTDHGYMHGAIDFYQECKSAGIKPIIGVEAYLCQGNILDKTNENSDLNHITLLARNKIGYKNLIKLMTIGATDGFYYSPRINKELLSQYKEGLICLSGCLEGEIHTHLYTSESKKRVVDLNKARDLIDQYKSIFGEYFFMEFMNHGIHTQAEQSINALRLVDDMKLKVVATNDSHYASKEDRKLRDIILADRTHSCLNDPNRALKDKEGEFYIKTADQMAAIFGEQTNFIKNTLAIAEMVEDYDPGLLDGHRLPTFPGSSSKAFKGLLIDGFKKRYPGSTKESAPFQRLIHEAKVIEQLGFRDYFLILHDLISYANRSGIPIGPGRGSAAGSIISYCLDITSLDPISNGLLFERFLNPGRKSLPDIDVDVCKEKRGQLIKYIYDKYGKDSVAQIVTFGRMKGKGAIRNLGKVMEIEPDTIEYLSSIMPPDAQEFTISLSQIINKDKEVSQELINKFQDFMSQSNKNKEFIDACVRLEGNYRNSGVHAAGIVIGPEPLSNIIPLKNSKDGSIVTQFSMEEVEALGLLKFDLLGLDTLTMVSNCLYDITKDNPDGPLKDKNLVTIRDLIPLLGKFDDSKVYSKVFKRGTTLGVFQCDSTGIRELLVRIKCSSFSDICSAISLYRPGPLDSGITNSFINRRHGREKETVWVESARQYMTDTHGLPIYQEQIMFVSRELCGFNLQEADDLRKVIGKKKKEDIQKFRTKFVEAAVKHSKISEESANDIYNEIEKYGRYAFNRSHAAAYAVICYVTAWLKTYYPEYFIVALLNKFCAISIEKLEDSKVSKKKDDERLLLYIMEALSLKIKIEAPNINSSHYLFKVKGPGLISYGLGCVKGIGPKLIPLIENRGSGFKSFQQFIIACISSGINSKIVDELHNAKCIDFGIPEEEYIKQTKGYKRPCRCVKIRGNPKPDCKLCNGNGLGKTDVTIFDDIRKLIKDEVDLTNVEDIVKVVTTDTSNTKVLTQFDPPGVYISNLHDKT